MAARILAAAGLVAAIAAALSGIGKAGDPRHPGRGVEPYERQGAQVTTKGAASDEGDPF